jgi:hypothetical protein
VELFARQEWQMAPGERAAIAGVLAELRPSLSIELGTAQGGSLRTIAAYSREVHSFDFAPEVADLPSNVTLHVGDSHELLPRLLASLAADGRNVDFALVDGDHSPEGVRRDVLDLLGSPAVTDTVIVLHDTANAQVRAGLEAADVAVHPKVRLLDFALVELQRPGAVLMEEWGGLGLIVVGPDDGAPRVVRNRRRPQPMGRRAAAPARAAIRRVHGLARDRGWI